MFNAKDEVADSELAQLLHDSAKSMSLDMYADLLEKYAEFEAQDALGRVARALRDCGAGMSGEAVKLVVLDVIADELGVQP